jgi:hypothetical protein
MAQAPRSRSLSRSHPPSIAGLQENDYEFGNGYGKGNGKGNENEFTLHLRKLFLRLVANS